MRYRIEFADDLMHVLDEQNYGHDAHVVQPGDAAAAERKIGEWATEYGIEPKAPRRQLRDLLRRM